ncbi:MAG: D-aminoacyl-tRNA deacylase [Bacteroidota bacterium]
MRVIVQRVSQASVISDGVLTGEIGQGFVILLGIQAADTADDLEYIIKKVSGLRVFGDEEGKMNRSIHDVSGQILLVSQFTLYASTKKGNRPSFIQAARPEDAIPLYEACIASFTACGLPPQTGVFGADMQLSLVNDGPVTIFIDSRLRE